MNKEKTTATGRTPVSCKASDEVSLPTFFLPLQIYDFDEWTRQHYGRKFDHQQQIKQKKQRNEQLKPMFADFNQLQFLVVLIVVFIIFSSVAKEEFDVDRTEKRKNLKKDS